MIASVETIKAASHGSEKRYKYGCRCEKCTWAAVRAAKERDNDRLQGRPRRVPGGPVRDYIAALLGTGRNYAQIAREAGVSKSSVRRALLKDRPVNRTTALAILSVPLEYTPPVTDVSALGAMRRLRALYVLAHGRDEIARTAGLHPSTITEVVSGRCQTIDTGTDTGARRAYTVLSKRRGTSASTAARACREGWHGPLAWEDIDNPDAAPEPEPPRIQRRSEARAEDIAFLAQLGTPREEIARRVGCSADYVQSQLAGWRAPGIPRVKARAA